MKEQIEKQEDKKTDNLSTLTENLGIDFVLSRRWRLFRGVVFNIEVKNVESM
jgi:hypothetical protein